MPASPTLVRRPRQLTRAWAQGIIDRHHPGVSVRAVRIRSMETGTTTRIRLAVDHNGPARIPRRWFVKLPSRNWRARVITALPRLLQTEVRFYNEVARLVPIPRPALLAAEARPGRGALLVLADITETGAVAGKPTDTLTPAQARHMIAILARLHAKFQTRPDLEQDYPWLAGPVRRLEDRLGTLLGPALMRRGLRLAAGRVDPSLHGPLQAYAAHRRQVMAFLNPGPGTLVHHDCHPGNLYWHDSQPGLLDWQLLRIGEGIGDIAYLLATALEPEVRRGHEIELLNHYRECLAGEGIDPPQSGQLLLRYRAHLSYPLEAMLITAAVGGLMEVSANLELVQRAASAAADRQAFAALAV